MLRVSYDALRDRALVEGDADGDRAADFAIELQGNVPLSEDDFADGSLVGPLNLLGTEEADSLIGGDGNDRLDGGLGADQMDGGTGSDTVTYRSADSSAYVSLWSGRGYWGEAQGDTYASVESADGGRRNDYLIGNNDANVLNSLDGVDRLYAYDGDDTLIGCLGADFMHGGAGADLYLFDDAGDRTIEAADDGMDTVRASVSHTLADNVENLQLVSGAGGIDAIGNALANTITGNAGDNVLIGDAGSDTFVFASF